MIVLGQFVIPLIQPLLSSCVPPKTIRKQHHPCLRPYFPSKIWGFLTEIAFIFNQGKKDHLVSKRDFRKCDFNSKMSWQNFILVNIECCDILGLWRDIYAFFKPKVEKLWSKIFISFKCLSKIDITIINKHFNSMGPIVSLIKGNDKRTEMENAAKQALDLGLKMVNTRFDAFEAQLNLSVGAIKKVPGQYLIASKRTISCNVSQGTQANRTAISGIVSDFAKGGIAEGITNTLFTALDIILGSFSASYDESQDYMLLSNLIGGVYRIDYLVINQKLTATGITSGISSVFGSYLIVSSVLKSELKDNDNVYKILVDRQFADKTVRMKFILIKLMKDLQLTPEEMNLVSELTYSPPKFDDDGNLVDANGNRLYPPTQEELDRKKREAEEKKKNQQELEDKKNNQINSRSANVPLPKRLPQEDYNRLSQVQKLNYELTFNHQVSAQLELEINEAKTTWDKTNDDLLQIEVFIKEREAILLKTNKDIKGIESKLVQAQKEDKAHLISLVKELVDKGVKLQEVEKEIKEAESHREHAPPAEHHS